MANPQCSKCGGNTKWFMATGAIRSLGCVKCGHVESQETYPLFSGYEGQGQSGYTAMSGYSYPESSPAPITKEELDATVNESEPEPEPEPEPPPEQTVVTKRKIIWK